MGDSTELLVLRLALIGVIFAFVLGVSLSMRAGLVSRQAGAPQRRVVRGPRFVVLARGQTGLEIGDEIAVAGEMTIGRDPANGIVLGDPSVSSFHAVLLALRDGWRLSDSGSTNGTLVNGHPVDARGVILQGGEEVSFGKVVLRLQR